MTPSAMISSTVCHSELRYSDHETAKAKPPKLALGWPQQKAPATKTLQGLCLTLAASRCQLQFSSAASERGSRSLDNRSYGR
jgi:hypothetical protein